MFGLFKNKTASADANSLVDEKENKALLFILSLVFIGLVGIITYANQDRFYTTMITLFFVSGAIFTCSSLIGFLFGIPRPTVIDESERSKSGYIGNDNLLQVSDWITKIIVGLGLTQIHRMPKLLQENAAFIMKETGVSNQAFIILLLLYYASLGFLFGYLWTRLYFIKMLHASDSDISQDDDSTTKVTTQIKTDITTDVTTSEDKK